MTSTFRQCKASCLIALLSTFLLLADLQSLAAAQASQSNSSSSADNQLPDAPQAQNQPSDSSSSLQQNTQPSGAAGAKAATPKGAPVAQPAGAAVAPARQRGHRSLLIKIGLLAGAGIAVGSAAALSHGSPSRPPGASASATSHP